jgi:lysophospholipase L1-like esterase
MENKKGILISLVFSLLLLLSIEVSISFLLPQSRLDKILAVLERSPNLIWKQRPNLKTIFFKEEIITDGLGLRNKIKLDSKNKTRMVVLGASPSFGWGVPQSETYAKRIEKYFSNKLEVINAAHIGHSSYQGLEFLKQNIEILKPDIISIPYVINDVDRFRFFEHSNKADHERMAPNSFAIQIVNYLNKFETTRLIRTVLKKLPLSYPTTSNKAKNLTPRVPLKEYEKNLREFITLSKIHNFKIIFIKMPVNLPLKYPSKLSKKNIELKQIQSIKAARDSLEYNRSLEKIALTNLLPLVDIVSTFREYEGEYLFVDKKFDTIHPNSLGHSLISKAIIHHLEHMLPSI